MNVIRLSSIVLGISTTIGCAYAQNTTEKQKEESDTLKKELKEITVEASKIVTTNGKMLLFVDDNTKKHSYDGFSALQQIQAPGLIVDVINGGVSAYGKNVLLCINGLEASISDIKSLNPQDIIRIDYYTNYNPKHPESKYTLDYILKIRDYGGTVMLQPTQALNIESGNEFVNWKIYTKKAEFSINANYDHLHSTINSNSTTSRTFKFTEGDLTNSQLSLPSRNNINKIDVSLSYIQRFNHNSILKATVGYDNNHGNAAGEKEETYSGLFNQTTSSSSYYCSGEESPYTNIVYQQQIAKYGNLRLQFGGSYYDTDLSRDYNGLQQYQSLTKGSGYRLIPKLNFSWKINKFEPSFYYTYNRHHTNSTYTQNGTTSSTAYTYQINDFTPYIKYSPNDKISIGLIIADKITNEHTAIGSHTTNTFSPQIWVSYHSPTNGEFNIGFTYGDTTPSSNLFNTTERREDDYVIEIGNPNLKIQREYSTFLSYYEAHKWGWWNICGFYNVTNNSIYQTYTRDDERNLFIRSYDNGKNYKKSMIHIAANYALIPSTLSITGICQYYYTSVRNTSFQKQHTIYSFVTLNFTRKGFAANLTVYAPNKSLDVTGLTEKTSTKYDLNLGYNYNNWSFNFMTRNPFSKIYTKRTYTRPEYYSVTKKYNPKLEYNYFALRISYKFSYGKPHKYQDEEMNEGLKSYNLGTIK